MYYKNNLHFALLIFLDPLIAENKGIMYKIVIIIITVFDWDIFIDIEKRIEYGRENNNKEVKTW